MSVFATVTLVMVPAAFACLWYGLHWWYGRRLAAVEAERDRAVKTRDRYGDGLNEVRRLLESDWSDTDGALAAVKAALEVGTYAGDLLAARAALEQIAAENAHLRTVAESRAWSAA